MLKNILIFSICLVIFSCKKEDDTVTTSLLLDSDLVVSELKAQLLLDEVDEITTKIEEGIEQNYSLSQLNSLFNCASITSDTLIGDSIFSDTIQFNIEFTFGACTPSFGLPKTGNLTMLRTGDYFKGEYYHKITSDNFSIDTTGVLLSQTLTFNGYKPDSSRIYLKNRASTLKFINQSSVAREEVYELTWIAGFNTFLDPSDDEWVIEGESIGITGEGIGFQKLISKPLNLVSGCKYYQTGEMKLTPEGRVTRQVKFLDENCIGKVSVEVGNLIEVINISEQ